MSLLVNGLEAPRTLTTSVGLFNQVWASNKTHVWKNINSITLAVMSWAVMGLRKDPRAVQLADGHAECHLVGMVTKRRSRATGLAADECVDDERVDAIIEQRHVPALLVGTIRGIRRP